MEMVDKLTGEKIKHGTLVGVAPTLSMRKLMMSDLSRK